MSFSNNPSSSILVSQRLDEFPHLYHTTEGDPTKISLVRKLLHIPTPSTQSTVRRPGRRIRQQHWRISERDFGDGGGFFITSGQGGGDFSYCQEGSRGVGAYTLYTDSVSQFLTTLDHTQIPLHSTARGWRDGVG